MIPQRHITRFAQLTTKRLAATALALGLAATVLAPITAQAAPLNPAKGPTFTAELVPVAFRPNVNADKSIGLIVQLKNTGSTKASPATIKVETPDWISFESVLGGSNYGCSVSGRTILCTLNRALEGGETQGVGLLFQSYSEGQYEFAVTADPGNDVKEVNENNNRTSTTAYVN